MGGLWISSGVPAGYAAAPGTTSSLTLLDAQVAARVDTPLSLGQGLGRQWSNRFPLLLDWGGVTSPGWLTGLIRTMEVCGGAWYAAGVMDALARHLQSCLACFKARCDLA